MFRRFFSLGGQLAEAIAGQPSLKDGNTKRLLAVLVINAAGFYIAEHTAAVTWEDWFKLATGWLSVLPAGVGVAFTGILNAQASNDMKARLVFWRWQHPYPGSRAFSHHGHADPRVDMAALEQEFGSLPTDPTAQNELWYRLYRAVRNTPEVLHVHQQFLFARDYSFMALVMLLLLGGTAAAQMRPLPTVIIYIALLIGQWLLTTRAANVTGHRFVTTVMAQKGAGN